MIYYRVKEYKTNTWRHELAKWLNSNSTALISGKEARIDSLLYYIERIDIDKLLDRITITIHIIPL